MSENLEIIDNLKQASELACHLILAGGQITAEIESALTANADQSKQVDLFGYVLHSVMMQAELANARILQWQGIKNSAEEALKKLKERTKALMEASGIKEIIGEQSTFFLALPPPAVVIENAKAIPREYISIEYPEPVKKIENEKILADLSKGVEVPGCKLDKTPRLIHRVSLREVQ